MLKTLLIIALLLSAEDAFGQSASGNLSVTVTPSGSPTGSGACPGGNSGFVPAGYTCNTTLTDEFNGSSLDTSKWTVGWQGSCDPNCVFPPTNPVVSGGNLQLTSITNSAANSTQPGGVYSKSTFPPAPSYWEVRVAIPPDVSYQADWMMDLVGVPHIEIDMQETQFNNQCANLHDWTAGYTGDLTSSGQPSISGNGCHGNSNWTDGNFHTYGMHRHVSGGTVVLDFYMDGQLTTTITPSGTNANLFATSTAAMVLQVNSKLVANRADTALVDYVRVYCPGCQ